MREQESVNSFTFKAFFSIHPGFQPTKHEPLHPKQTQWKCGVLRQSLLTFSVILKNDFVAESHQTTVRPTNSETGHRRAYSTTKETLR